MCTDEFLKRGVLRKKLVLLDILVSKGFQRRLGRQVCREMLGMEENYQWVLIMEGGMGAEHISQLTRCLLCLMPERVHLAVVRGSNEKLREHMQKNVVTAAWFR